MRAISSAVVSSKPCSLATAQKFLKGFCGTPDSYLASSDCATYVVALDEAIREQHRFLRRCGPAAKQQGAANLDADGYEGLVEGERERQGGEETEAPAGGSHGFVEEAKVAFTDGEKNSKKRKKEEEPHEDKAVAGVGSHIPASPEILFEQRKTKKWKHSNKELASVAKQEPDLVVEEELGSERNKKKKKKEKSSAKESASIVKQEPCLVLEEELGGEKKKGKKKKEKVHVKMAEEVVEVKGQIVNNGVAANGEKERKKKKHSEEEGNLKGVKQEEKMPTDSDLNSEKKKKMKRGRGDDDVQEQGGHKKKQRK